jgi:hypothetical protein
LITTLLGIWLKTRHILFFWNYLYLKLNLIYIKYNL